MMKRESLMCCWKLCRLLAVVVAIALGGVARGQQFVMTEEQFNSWVTGGNASPRQRTEAQSTVELRALEELCRITPRQKAKLALAASGDMERFESSVAELREEMVGKSYDQNEINDLYQRIQPLQQRFQAGLLGDASLFRKSLSRTLTPAQLEEYEAAQSERRAVQYAAKVRLYVAVLEHAMPMSADQRQKLVEHLLKTTRPPKRFGSQDIYYVMHQASQAPIDDLAAVFDEAQMKVLQAAFVQGRGYEHFLKQQGYAPDDRPRPAKPKDVP